MPEGSRYAGKPMTFKGSKFYRIIYEFINQGGTSDADVSIYGDKFDDDPGGLALSHNRTGLLSMANSGAHHGMLMLPFHSK